MAHQKMWSEAILLYLRQNWRKGIPFPTLLNEIVGESMPPTRPEIRARTKAALAALMSLVRQKKVMRYQQKTVAILDLR